jgi:hypothetical protein
MTNGNLTEKTENGDFEEVRSVMGRGAHNFISFPYRVLVW